MFLFRYSLEQKMNYNVVSGNKRRRQASRRSSRGGTFVNPRRGGRALAQVKKIVKAEIKKAADWRTNDQGTAGGTISATTGTGYYHHITAVAEGDDYNERQGRTIEVSKVMGRGFIRCPANFTNPSYNACNMETQAWRWAVVQFPNELSSAPPLVSKYWSKVPQDEASCLGFLKAPLHGLDASSIKVFAGGTLSISEMYDGEYAVANGGSDYHSARTKFFSFFKHFKKPLKVTFEGTAATTCTAPIFFVIWPNTTMATGGSGVVNSKLELVTRIKYIA